MPARFSHQPAQAADVALVRVVFFVVPSGGLPGEIQIVAAGGDGLGDKVQQDIPLVAGPGIQDARAVPFGFSDNPAVRLRPPLAAGRLEVFPKALFVKGAGIQHGAAVQAYPLFLNM